MDARRRTRLLRRARFTIYAVAAAALVYLVLRFDLTTLPQEGCSPLRSIEPGASLWVDLWPRDLVPGDQVVFRGPGGELLLGAVATVPASAPEEVWRAVEAGALWIEGNVADCPSRDSRILGPIEVEAVEGRILLSFGGG